MPKTNERRALAGLSLSMLLSSLGTSIANVALPTLQQAFAASFQQAQWIVLIYLLTITATIVGAGRIGDMIGTRRLLLAGLALFTLASVLCGLAPTLWLLLAARALQGLGAAIMMALTLAFVSETVPKEKAGAAMGLLGTMSAAGTALGPSLGGLLISAFGWRAIFFISVPPGLLALFLAHLYLPRCKSPRKAGSFDFAGAFLLTLALAAYALSMTLGRGDFGPLNIALLLAAACGAGLFIFAESRSPEPLVRLDLFRDANLSGGLAMSALVSTVLMATLIVGPFYLSRTLGLDPARVGLIMSAGPLMVAFTGVPAGKLTDKFGVRRITVAGLFITLTGCALLSALPAASGIPGYMLPIIVVTFGYALFQTANNTAIMSGVDPGRRGLISGMLNLSRNLGLVTGAAVMGALFAAAGLHAAFAAATALIALALAIAATGKRKSGI